MLLSSLIVALVSGCPVIGTASAAVAPSKVIILPFRLLDTSAEPKDQNAEHARRLRTLAADVASDLSSVSLYQTIMLEEEDVRRTCASETTDCLLSAARARGADIVFFGVVHKSSTLILQIWARFADARTGQVLFSRELNFRGDNDESWRRAAQFLSAQIKSAPPQSP